LRKSAAEILNARNPILSREKLAQLLEGRTFSTLILAIILFNAALMGMETSPGLMARFGGVIDFLDQLCLIIFVVELVAKLYANGLRFFRSGWNVFDLIIIGIALVPAAHGLSVLRALRVLRVMRVISVAPSLRRVVEGFITALPGMGSVFLLMAMIFYVAAVMATQLYGADFPEKFGTLTASALTLFQVMTLEGWAGDVVRPVMEVHPYAWAFFLPFILITTFAVVNLLVGLIVNSMQAAAEADTKAAEDDHFKKIIARLESIEGRLPQK
jgi:voltage-gated sodium channel